MSDNTIIAYQQLDKNDAHLFRLLGLLIEPEFGAEVVAIMMDTSLRTAKLSLERLTRANLVEQMPNQRYRLLARARRFARQTLEDEPLEVQTTTRLQAIRWYSAQLRKSAKSSSGEDDNPPIFYLP